MPKPVSQEVVDRYICARMDGDYAVTTAVLEACIEWDRANPEHNGAAMAQIH